MWILCSHKEVMTYVLQGHWLMRVVGLKNLVQIISDSTGSHTHNLSRTDFKFTFSELVKVTKSQHWLWNILFDDHFIYMYVY